MKKKMENKQKQAVIMIKTHKSTIYSTEIHESTINRT